MEDKGVRLQKIIADSGLASRRLAEEWIKEGLITVNGHTASLGQKADPGKDAIKIRGRLLKIVKKKEVTLAMNKPKGYICSHSDPYHDKTIFDLLPRDYFKKKLMCAGRLDIDSQGLVILTTDGDLAQKITHPSHGIVKRYLVTLSRPLEEKLIPKLLKGKHIDGELLNFAKIVQMKIGPKADLQVEVHLTQGRKREIRRLFEAFGYFVDRLKRIQIGGLTLKGISPGRIKELDEKELSLLLKK